MAIPDLKATIALLRSQGTDGQEIEVKAAFHGFPKSVLPALSAFANKKGGTIILGLNEEDGFTTSATFDASAIADALVDACRDKISPSLDPNISIEPFESHKIVIAYIPEVPIEQKPVFIAMRGMYNGSYTRLHDANVKLTQYEIDRLQENSFQPRHDLQAIPQASLDDFSEDIVQATCSRERTIKPRIFGSRSNEEILLHLQALIKNEDGSISPTLAGLLTFGTYPQKYFPRLNVTFSHYPGSSKGEVDAQGKRFLDNHSFEGPIPHIIQEAVAAVRSNMRIGGKIVGAFRYEVPDYPLASVREAITNAIMHRDYSPMAQGGQVQVNMYRDRLEIANPGGLYSLVNPENLGETFITATRNMHLSRLLESVPYGYDGFVAENRGTGYKSILRELEAHDMRPPVIHNSLTYFALNFYRNNPPEDYSTSSDSPASPQSDSFIPTSDFGSTNNPRSTHPTNNTNIPGSTKLKNNTNNPGSTKLINNTNSPDSSSSPGARVSTVEAAHQAILTLIAEHKKLGVRKIASLLDVPVTRARHYLQTLVKQGYLERTEPITSPKQKYRLKV